MPHATVNGTQLYYERAGAGAPPLVFVHGFGCAHEDWQPQVEAFSARHMVISCDLRGHGASPGEPESCNIETYGADVAALAAGAELERRGARRTQHGHAGGAAGVPRCARPRRRRRARRRQLPGGRGRARRGGRAPDDRVHRLRGVGRRAVRADVLRAERDRRRGSARAPNGSRKRSARRSFRGWCAGTPGTWRPRSAASACRCWPIQSTMITPERKRVPLAPGANTPWPRDGARAARPTRRSRSCPASGTSRCSRRRTR